MMSFFRRRDGNMAMIFALCLVPMVGLAGFAIDSSRQHSASSALQSAVDAAVLSAVQTVADETMTELARKQAAADLVLANFSVGDASLNPPVVTFPSPNAMRVEVTGTVPTTATSILGNSSMVISASSGARFSAPSVLESVLVLDVTESMEGEPLQDLKTAALQFVDDIIDTRRPNVKMGIVPFNRYVNVGLSNRSADWIDVPADYSTSEEVCRMDGCTCNSYSTTEWVNDETDALHSRTVCDSWDCSMGVEVCETDIDDYQWYGCVKSRAKPYHIQDTRWDIDVEGFVTHGSQGCPANEILPLTNVEGHLTSAINGLVADGKTYMATGIAWGLRVLSPDAPFIGGMDASTFAASNGTKLMVLMSDGSNTRSLSSDGLHDDMDVADANIETLAACQAVKDAGVELFVIAFNVTDTDTIDMLRDCATTYTHYSSATDLSSLMDAFSSTVVAVGQITMFE